MKTTILPLLASLCLPFLHGCSSIQPMGDLGPKKLKVYAISHNDFLSASRMLVILDKKGNVVAGTGSTVTGGGAVMLQSAGSLATAGAIAYGAKAIQNGLTHMHVKGVPSTVTLKGIPSSFKVNTTSDIHFHKD